MPGGLLRFIRNAPDRFSVRAVCVRESSGDQTPILEGISTGEQISVRGTFALKSRLLKASMENE